MAVKTDTIKVVIDTVDKFSKDFNKLQTKLQKSSASLKKFGVAIGVVALAMAKTVIDAEEAFAGVRKTVDATEKEFRKLETAFIDISKSTPLAFTELAKIGELAGQLGIQGVDNIESFTKTIAQVAVTTDMTAESASVAFARIAGIMQEPIKNVDRMASAVVELGNNTKSTESEIVAFSLRLAGAGKVTGISTKDLLGMSAGFTSVGIQAELGGTAVSKALLIMATAVEEGGDKLDILAKTAGVTSDEFRKQWGEDAPMAFNSFVEGLGKQGLKGSKTLDNLGLSSQRVKRTFLSIAGAGSTLNDTLKISRKGWEENNALTEEANKRFETTASQLKILWNNVKALAMALADLLLPLIRLVVGVLKGMVETVGVLIKGIKGMGASIAWIMGSTSTAVSEYARVAKVLEGLHKTGEISAKKYADEIHKAQIQFGLIKESTDDATESTIDFSKTFEEMGGIIPKVIDKTTKTVKTSTDEIKDSYKEMKKSFNDNIVDDIIAGTNIIESVFNQLSKAILKKMLTDTFDPLATAMADIVSSTVKATGISGIVGGIFSAFTGGIGGLIGGAIGSLFGLADGGIVTKPTVAMVGEGGEPEAVIPLSKLDRMIGGGGGGITINIGATMGNEADAYSFAKMITKYQEKINRRNLTA